ncbi:hypothetical protein BT96DRAFT_1011735 [Gymnopus androsaceus JB14]|uniref:Sphingolipid long chain base-responsive protein LSP1 n=1 Tax=Gymnopus androsaceus JB14 TaxID=1447944 RepID=A0A6A4IKS2_9AGAR|nr:hypothetical protein BT96DRAFT_1011735 [Gymnopus androsaceus JB14]
MPIPGFISSFADKAQSAIAEHLPSHRPGSPDSASANTAAPGASSLSYKNPTIEAIQHQLRSLGQQYGSGTTPIQKIITSTKGAQSKELYTWGQGEDDDLKDVTDRLAYIEFVSGSLAASLAKMPILPRRNIRAGLHTQLSRLEHENAKGNEKRIAELKDQIRKEEAQDLPHEKEIELLKRKAIRESEQMKFQAIREYGEKLVLLSQAAYPVIAALPTLPPSPDSPYTGAQATGAARASLQRALDNYKTGHINLPPQMADTDLSRSDTRSFGESHASELSSINSDATDATQSNVPLTPPTGTSSLPVASQSPPINPSNLNLSPASIPSASSTTSFGGSSSSPAVAPIVAPDPLKPSSMISDVPTVAETGVPVVASQSGGPGPASGSLRDIKAASPTAGPRSGGFPANEVTPTSFGAMGAPSAPSAKWESADAEKKRLAEQYSQAGGAPAPKYESADEEKKRLEREEREKLLSGSNAGNSGAGPSKKDDDDELPPYQDV